MIPQIPANNFNFEIDPSTDGFNHFRVDNFGNIFVNNYLNREQIQEYSLTIILKDSFYPFTGKIALHLIFKNYCL